MAWAWLVGTAKPMPFVASPLAWATCVSVRAFAMVASLTLPLAREQNSRPRMPPCELAVIVSTTLLKSTCSPSRFRDNVSSCRVRIWQILCWPPAANSRRATDARAENGCFTTVGVPDTGVKVAIA